MKFFNAKNFPFYYGWFLLPFASIGVIMSIPGQTAGFSAFTDPLITISGITRTALSTAYLFGTLSSGFILPFVGRFVDTIGSRKMMIFASISLGITLLLLSQVEKTVQGIHLLFSFIPIKMIFFTAFIAGIFCLRFFGQGMLPIISNTMVGKWFDTYRGRAVAAMGIINSLAFNSAPTIMNALVSAKGWKNAWLILSAITGVGMSSIAFLIYRKNPESCGLHVDGLEPVKNSQKYIEEEITGMSVKDARKTIVFWLISIGLTIYSAIITGFTFHIEAIGNQLGMPTAKALAIFIPVSFIAIPVSFIGSWVSNKLPVYFYLLCVSLGELTGFISIFYLNATVGYTGAIIGLGFAGGLLGPILSTIVPKLFGRKHLGAINSAIASMMVVGSAIGPVYLSLFNDFNKSFVFGILISATLPLIILIMSYRMRKKLEAVTILMN